MAGEQLSTRALNRASLARQYLLERADVELLDAVAHLGGLQAQEPLEPFIGLWSRLRDFDPGALDALLDEGRVVRTHLMRRTVHLVTADDALAWRSRHDAMMLQRLLGVYRADLDGVDLEELADAARAVLARGPRSTGDLGRALTERWSTPGHRVLGETAVIVVPLVQLPPRGRWSTPDAGVRHELMSTWLGREVDPVGTGDGGDGGEGRDGEDGEDAVGRQLVRRYLAAFGPAASADLRAWCGLAGLPAAVAAVRDELASFRDERGRELLDLPDAPRPDPDTPAPVRFLPAFDNAILSYDDRSRIVDRAHRALSVNGQRAVLVDGRVAGTWTVEENADGHGTLSVAPLRRFTRADRAAVAEEARSLMGFLSEGRSTRVRVAASPH